MNRLTFTNQLGVAEFTLRSRQATARDAKNLFDDMPWRMRSAIRITSPENVTLEISGSQSEGMTMAYETAKRSVTTSASPEQCRKTLGRFAEGDVRWQEGVTWQEQQATDGDAKASRSGCLAILAFFLLGTIAARLVAKG